MRHIDVAVVLLDEYILSDLVPDKIISIVPTWSLALYTCR